MVQNGNRFHPGMRRNCISSCLSTCHYQRSFMQPDDRCVAGTFIGLDFSWIKDQRSMCNFLHLWLYGLPCGCLSLTLIPCVFQFFFLRSPLSCLLPSVSHDSHLHHLRWFIYFSSRKCLHIGGWNLVLLPSWRWGQRGSSLFPSLLTSKWEGVQLPNSSIEHGRQPVLGCFPCVLCKCTPCWSRCHCFWKASSAVEWVSRPSCSSRFHVNGTQESVASALGQLLSLCAPLHLRVPLDKGVSFQRQWSQPPNRL